jgi:hypothetical protein
MPSVDVIIPWKPGDIYREIVLGWVLNAWNEVGSEPIIGNCDGDWSKAVAVRDAVSRSTAEWLIVTDADVWCAMTLDVTHQIIESDDRWGTPHGLVHRLTPVATSDVLKGAMIGGPVEQRPYPGVPGGGIVILERELWDECPLDRRFVGWGQEDEAWGAALACIGGKPFRGDHDLWHLWHPPAPRANRAVGSHESRRLRNEYYRARRDENVMRRLLDQA